MINVFYRIPEILHAFASQVFLSQTLADLLYGQNVIVVLSEPVYQVPDASVLLPPAGHAVFVESLDALQKFRHARADLGVSEHILKHGRAVFRHTGIRRQSAHDLPDHGKFHRL